jgi:DNA double-strand break repair helicase HerA and related ATPase
MTGPEAGKLFIGAGTAPASLTLRLANRHGLIAGATGTGKTVTLQVLAEGFADAGVPVFLADVKGDLSGMCMAGAPNPKIDERVAAIGLDGYTQRPAPVVFWDLFGDKGHPIRTTISDMGPLLLSRLLDLSDAQEGTLSVVFQVADDEGLLLLDLKDLRALLQYASEQKDRLSARYGNVNKTSVGAIQRRLLTLEQEGGDMFFGEPALDLRDFMRTDFDGRGFVNVLAADRLMTSPRLYATFLLWLLSELFEELPEVGDPEKPRLVFFFDEAHLLFDDAPKALADKVEQVVRLIRSKGVGVYFVSQSPMDIPEAVLGQLGNRVQHALRAFTPRDQKVIKATAETFRRNPKLDAETALTELGVGEALVSTLEGKGAPSIVERVLVRPPASRIGPAGDAERKAVLDGSPVRGRYDTPLDRESAYELLTKRAEAAAAAAPPPQEVPHRTSNRMSVAEVVMREVGRTLGREIVRGILGSIFKRR